jgi:photosynthetic reaction center cytochrome c subunit
MITGFLDKFRCKRVILTGGIAIASLALGTSGLHRVLAQGQSVAKPQMSEQAFKNIQVLKGIPVDEFMGAMGLFSAALSVCCGDCHEGAGGSNPKWEADPPRKQVARRMVQMVNALNRDNFQGRQVVTCWTCHRGNERPSTTPAMDMVYGEPVVYPADIVPTANGQNLPTANQIFEKYIQAAGGSARLDGLTSYIAKGTTQLYGETDEAPVEIYAKKPNQLTMMVHEQEGDLARVFDGHNGWVMLPLTVVGLYPLNGSSLEGAKLDGQLFFPAGLKQSLNNWRVSFPATIDGHDMYVVQGNGAAGLVVSLYFDKQSGLLRRAIRYAVSAMGRVPTQWDYSDYRSVAGMMMPFKFTYSWISGREDYTLKEIQANVPVDSSKFEMPVPRRK